MKHFSRALVRPLVTLDLALAVLLWPALAQAQCAITAQSADRSTTGHPTVQASTTWCSAYIVYVKAHIQNLATACLTGTSDGADCKSSSDTSNANVNAKGDACGSWNGWSYHYYYSSLAPPPTGNPTDVQYGRITPLYAGSCPPPPDICDSVCQCNQLGPDYYWDGLQCQYTPGSPIVVATSRGATYKLTSVENGVLFDINGDGRVEQIAWTEPDSDIAFLALDRDGDGKISSGKELFGNHTSPNSRNGFDALLEMTMATNGGILRGSVTDLDPIFSRLLLWTDRNHNGVSEPEELRPAAELFAEIGLGYKPTTRVDQFGNMFRFKGWASARTASGHNTPMSVKEERERKLTIWDVYFKM